MIERKKIFNIIYDVLRDLNEDFPKESKISISEDTVLYGSKSKLDSFGLVNLIVGVEEKIQDITGRNITLADEKALSRKNSPFLTVKTFSDYISELLHENQN